MGGSHVPDSARVGAVVVAAYWHPIKAAGEAALLDLYSGGRLEFGIGSGAYQREFDRLHPGLKRTEGHRYSARDAFGGEGSVARRLRAQGRVRVLSGRDLGAEAVTETPSSDLDRSALTGHVRLRGQAPVQHPLLALTRPMSEVELYKKHMERALADNPGKPRPIFATMRHTVVYERKENWEVPVKAARCASFGQFENLFKNLGDVADGFPRTWSSRSSGTTKSSASTTSPTTRAWASA